MHDLLGLSDDSSGNVLQICVLDLVLTKVLLCSAQFCNGYVPKTMVGHASHERLVYYCVHFGTSILYQECFGNNSGWLDIGIVSHASREANNY